MAEPNRPVDRTVQNKTSRPKAPGGGRVSSGDSTQRVARKKRNIGDKKDGSPLGGNTEGASRQIPEGGDTTQSDYGDRGSRSTADGDRKRGQRERRGRRTPRDGDGEENNFIERVVKIRRVAKVVKGGRNLTFNAMVVVGDGKGGVGVALGSAGAVPDAVRKGTAEARKSMQKVSLNGTTIPHEVVARYSGARVFLKPAGLGTGIIAGGGVRPVMEAAGVTDVLSKSLGSNNTINVVKATLKALNMLRSPKVELARRNRIRYAAEESEPAQEQDVKQPTDEQSTDNTN